MHIVGLSFCCVSPHFPSLNIYKWLFRCSEEKKKQRWARLAAPNACWHQFCPKFDVKQSPNLYLKAKTKQRPVLDRSLLFLFHFFFIWFQSASLSSPNVKIFFKSRYNAVGKKKTKKKTLLLHCLHFHREANCPCDAISVTILWLLAATRNDCLTSSIVC